MPQISRSKSRLGIAALAVLLVFIWCHRRNLAESSDKAAPGPSLKSATGAGDYLPISLTICSISGPDGTRKFQRLDPPATAASLKFRLAALDALPVSFSADGRFRLVTRDLVVRLAGTGSSVLAGNPGLSVKSRPAYAPGWIVLRAADPLAALAALPGLRSTAGVIQANVALARQQVPRTLPDDPLISNQWHLKTSGSAAPGTDLNVESVWNYGAPAGIRGGGVAIGIVDDGLEGTHPDLGQNTDTALGHDWNGNDSDPSPGQGNRHGTACAGNAAARGNNSLGVSGVAPEATLAGMRLIAAPSTDEQEAESMVWKSDSIQIKSNSWGPDDTGNVLEGPGPLALAALESAATTGRGGLGTITVWAGGNGRASGDNSNFDGYANSIFTIATSAIDSAGNAASYSEPGANLVVCAPSSGSTLAISTTDLTAESGYNPASTAAGGDYTSGFGGTSAAAPLVAGVVALMLEKNPQLGWRDVQEILIRSATMIRPADSGWATNAAGFHFHLRFGAGLANAAAAVALAAGWENLPAREIVSQATAGAAAIPENDSVGVTVPFHFSGANLRVEHATVTVDISHTARGNLEIVLTSPGGTESRLAETHGDSNDDFPSWTFSTVRSWGESADGDWILKIADRSPAGNATGGTLNSATLRLSGSAVVPQNPPPAVAIVSPGDGAVFSPGAAVTVEIAASDLTVEGAAGTVAAVTLSDNGAPVGTLAAPPYSFEIQPTDGVHQLVARATDDEGAFADSAAVTISLQNRPPTISTAGLSAFGQLYADRELRVQSATAADPDGSAVAISYQWQSSADGISYTAAPGETSATLAAAPSHAGLLWRCELSPTDGELTGPPFLTAAVNLLARPAISVPPGGNYAYQSGLVLAGDSTVPTRRAIIHEFSQGPAGGNSEWVEILVLRTADLGYWDLSDSTNTLAFNLSGVWSTIPAGTLVVIYNGNAAKDPALPANDSDPADFRMIVSSTDPAFFSTTFDSWIPLANGGDRISLNDAGSQAVHSLSYGSASGPGFHLAAVGAGTAAHFSGDTESDATTAAAWQSTAAAAATPGAPNGPANAAFVDSIRAGHLVIPARFSLVSGASLPGGLALDSTTGLLSGTVTDPAGDYEIRIRRTNAAGGEIAQAFVLTIGSEGGYDAWAVGFPGPANLLDYALGSRPAFAIAAGAVALDFTRSKLRSDVEIVPESSADLATWTPAGIGISLLAESPNSQTIRATLPTGSPHRYLRLKILRVP